MDGITIPPSFLSEMPPPFAQGRLPSGFLVIPLPSSPQAANPPSPLGRLIASAAGGGTPHMKKRQEQIPAVLFLIFCDNRNRAMVASVILRKDKAVLQLFRKTFGTDEIIDSPSRVLFPCVEHIAPP